jgi:hypothetical protein
MKNITKIKCLIGFAVLLFACNNPSKVAEENETEVVVNTTEYEPTEDDFYYPDIQPDLDTEQDVYIYTKEVEGFKHIYLSYFGKNIPVESIVIEEDNPAGMISREEAFTYNLPKETVSAVWIQRYHDAGSEYYVVAQEKDQYKLYRMGFFGESELQKFEINFKLLGKWIKEGKGYDYLVFTGTGVYTSEFPAKKPYTVLQKIVTLHNNPDEVFEIVKLSDNELQLKDSYGSVIRYSK